MFYEPLRLMKPFDSVKQLLNYSKRVEIPGKGLPNKRYYKMENGNILYTYNPKFTYLTLPWLGLENFLKAYGFKKSKKLELPNPIPVDWYSDFALLYEQMKLQYWAAAFDKCKQSAEASNLQPVEIHEEVVFHDLTFHDYTFHEMTTRSFVKPSNITCKGMVHAFPTCNGVKNVGTFIYCETFLVVCDEYGRTFLLQQTSEENSLIPVMNRLIEAGYTINPTPNEYVNFQEN